MQAEPLLEQLDWFFTSANWTINFPKTEVLPLAKITSDHIPCKVMISTCIPKASLFWFENFWVEQNDFQEIVSDCWMNTPVLNDAAKNISSKFKALRARLKHWSRNLSNL
jgi:hypothetical protein